MDGREPKNEAAKGTGRALKDGRRLAKWRRTTSLAVFSTLLLAFSDRPQTVYSGVQETASSIFGPQLGDNHSDPLMEEKRLRALNADRQKAMVGDAGKLLRLATEFNAEIEQAKPDTLTPNQMRKLAEIEKLAHSVKEKMTTSVRMPVIYPALIP